MAYALYCVAEGFEVESGGLHSPGSDHESAAPARDVERVQALVAEIRRGDEAAFERLFKLYYERIVRYVVAIVRDRAIAEDVVQTVFARLWERRDQWDVQTTVEAYLVRAARNQTIDTLRRDRRARRWEQVAPDEAIGAAPSSPHAPDADAERRDLLQHVRRAVARLSLRHREILALKWGGRYTSAEIADITGQPVRTVETQVARAVRALRVQLGDALES